ncbi:MAG: EamA family transporter [Ignavibacteriae bacterium]|nr:EamA family transporter [Ignavibacteriota bacterium]
MKDLKGYLMIIGAAAFWGAAATLAKFLLNQQIDTLLLVQTRSTFSAVTMLVFLLLLSPRALRIRLTDLWRVAILGILGLAGANFTYYFTIKESTVATAITIQYTAALFVMAYEVLTREEQFTAVKALAAVLSLAGCVCAVTGLDFSVMQISSLGLLTGIGSILSFSLMTILTRHLVAGNSAWTVSFYSITFAGLFWSCINPPWLLPGQIAGTSVWLALVFLAMTSVLIPNLLFTAGLRYLVPTRAIITSTLEPVIAIATAALFIGERLSVIQLLGAALVIAAIIILQFQKEREAGGRTRFEPEVNNAA